MRKTRNASGTMLTGLSVALAGGSFFAAFALELTGKTRLSLPFALTGLAALFVFFYQSGGNMRDESSAVPVKTPGRYADAKTPRGTPFPWIAFAAILGIAVIRFATGQL